MLLFRTSRYIFRKILDSIQYVQRHTGTDAIVPRGVLQKSVLTGISPQWWKVYCSVEILSASWPVWRHGQQGVGINSVERWDLFVFLLSLSNILFLPVVTFVFLLLTFFGCCLLFLHLGFVFFTYGRC